MGEPLAAPGFVGWSLVVAQMMDEALLGIEPLNQLLNESMSQ
jgi:hypothetical protein